MNETVCIIEHLGCVNCAAKMETKIRALPQAEDASITFATWQLRVKALEPDALLAYLLLGICLCSPGIGAIGSMRPFPFWL